MGHNILPGSFYVNLSIRIILLSATALGLTWGLMHISDEYYLFAINAGILFIIQIWLLLRFIGQIDRELSRFLQAVRNDEFSGRMYDPKSKKGFDKFRYLLEQINQLIREKSYEAWEQEKWFQEVINESPGGLLIFNPSGSVQLANPSALRSLGFENLDHINELGKIDPILPSLFLKSAKGATFQIDRFLFRKSQMNTSTGIRMFVAVEDISKELIRKESDSWRKLIRVIRHEIMNSISPIPALSQSIRSGLYDENGKLIGADKINNEDLIRISKGLDIIEQTSSSILEFVNRYRQLTALPDPNFVPIDILQVLRESIALLEESMRTREIELTQDYHSQSQILMIDPGLLQRVFINLIKNAIEAVEQVKKPAISIKSRIGNGFLEIQFEDNGCGIQPDILEQIFVPFFSTKESGSGIGLSLARQIVVLHDGELNVVSEVGKGSRFRLILNMVNDHDLIE